MRASAELWLAMQLEHLLVQAILGIWLQVQPTVLLHLQLTKVNFDSVYLAKACAFFFLVLNKTTYELFVSLFNFLENDKLLAHFKLSNDANVSGNQGGVASTTGSSQMQEWVQGAIAKISNNTDGAANAAPNPISGRSSFMPISINTGTFPGTPAVRLIGDCHFLHRLCQLLLFCLLFRRRQSPRIPANAQKSSDSSMQKQHLMNSKTEDNTLAVRSGLGAAKLEDGTTSRGQMVGAKGAEENPVGNKSARIGSGNAGQGYTSDEVTNK